MKNSEKYQKELDEIFSNLPAEKIVFREIWEAYLDKTNGTLLEAAIAFQNEGNKFPTRPRVAIAFRLTSRLAEKDSKSRNHFSHLLLEASSISRGFIWNDWNPYFSIYDELVYIAQQKSIEEIYAETEDIVSSAPAVCIYLESPEASWGQNNEVESARKNNRKLIWLICPEGTNNALLKKITPGDIILKVNDIRCLESAVSCGELNQDLILNAPQKIHNIKTNYYHLCVEK